MDTNDGHRPGLGTPVSPADARAAPYAPDVRAKGWRFELDYEKIDQSLTWAMAPPEVRPWLLMMWVTAWKQTPCGSLEDDDAAITARMGMPAALFEQHRELLRRGWWLAEDGRIYHETMTERVLEMIAAKGKERQRKAEYRARNSGKAVVSARVPRMSHGTTMGQPRDSHGSDPGRDDTGTRTGTMNTPPYPPQAGDDGVGDSAEPTKTEVICQAIRAKGVPDADPSNATLQAYVDRGVTVEAFEAAAITTAKAGKRMNYLFGILERKAAEAAQVAQGPAPVPKAWSDSRSGIEAKGMALGIGRWDDKDFSADRETFGAYTQRVRRAVETGRVPA